MNYSIPRRCIRGFTLIELMITVVIVAVLGAIAYPSYTQYVVRSNRAATKAFMSAVANREQQSLLDARAYGVVTSNADFGTVLGMTVPTEVSNFYDVTIANRTVAGVLNPRTFIITAAPIATKMNANDGTLTLDETGVKAPADKW